MTSDLKERGPGGEYARRAGALLRSVANDLKRNDAQAAADLGVEPAELEAIFAGERVADMELIVRAATVWPVSERDLLPVWNDAPDGVRVMRAEESSATSRVIERGGGPYYEYRDTAMSRVGRFRPEWIRMLRVVDDDDPENPAVEWNNGHLLYQFTYFVGPVNYYYAWEGRRHCVRMRTGDSVWGLPFAPHTFTSRDDRFDAHILALTYGADLSGDAQQELDVLGPAASQEFAIESGDSASPHAALLARYMAAATMPHQRVAEDAGVAVERLGDLLAGTSVPSVDETARLAGALGVSVRDLLPPRQTTREGVRIQRRRDVRPWVWPSEARPDYRVRQLARCPSQPLTRPLEVEPLVGPGGSAASQEVVQHQYVYALGPGAVELTWETSGERRTVTLEPQDTAYLTPFVRHAYTRAGDDPAPLLVLRIGGAAGLATQFATGEVPRDARHRIGREDRLWYSPDESDRERPPSARP